MNDDELRDFAKRYAAAWSGRNPEAFSRFYAEDATFRINDGDASVGRDAIAATAGSFMEGFPDMVVELVDVREAGDGAVRPPDVTVNSMRSGRSVRRVERLMSHRSVARSKRPSLFTSTQFSDVRSTWGRGMGKGGRRCPRSLIITSMAASDRDQ